MSEQQNNGQRRNQGGNRNNNRNNNRNRNNSNNSNNNNRNNNNRNYKKREPKPLVLSGWQKFLKMIGLFNEEKAQKAHLQAEKVNKSLNQKSKPSHKRDSDNSSKPANKPNNTRNANAKPRRAPEKVAVETPRLYVGNLSYDASDSDIEELFKGIGNVKNVEIIYNRHTHRSKGYGFVQMFNTDDAKRAVDVLHDQPFLGRNLIVNGSKARNPDDPAAQANNDNAETADTSAA